jgi:hypothetical protein
MRGVYQRGGVVPGVAIADPFRPKRTLLILFLNGTMVPLGTTRHVLMRWKT